MDIIDAYALLSSMRKNLPENHSSYEEKYVRQYHNLVSSLETQLSIDLSPYKLDEFLLKREITSEAMSF